MTDKVVVLTGGVGGAKLVLGLIGVIAQKDVTAIVNTGDDFEHLGLRISPDLDTLLYTLSGKADQDQGWGREDESWNFLAAVRSLHGEDWFKLGDGDLALHVLRSEQLRRGVGLSEIIAAFANAWQIGARLLPMSNDPVSTVIATDQGSLPFQRYFVERRCEPKLLSIHFAGAPQAQAAPGVVEAILDRSTSAILIAPSNPYLSIDPILAVPGIRAALVQTTAPVVAISPIIAGQAIKGPTAKIMQELGIVPGPEAIAAHYLGLADALLHDERDNAGPIDLPAAVIDTLMMTLDDRKRVARAALDLAHRLRR